MSRPSITIEQARTFLRDELAIDALDVEALSPGAWSVAFAFRVNEKPFVLRIANQADDFARDAFAHRFNGPALPIPKVTHRGTFGDAHYAISERMPGDFLDNLDGAGLRKTMPSLLETFDALRTADISASTGYGTWDEQGNGLSTTWSEFLTTTIEDDPDFRGGPWRAKLEASPLGAETFDRDAVVLRRLAETMPESRHALHCDLINYNAFVENHCISGVIDWGCANYGDFVYELALWEFWRPWYPQWADIHIADEARSWFEHTGADLADFSERLVCYQIHVGLTHQIYTASIGSWDDFIDITKLTTQLADKVR